MSRSVIVEVAGLVNGVNKLFTTPDKFVATTLRVVWNGQVYEPGDSRWGWVELTDQSFETNRAPRTNDVIQAFYEAKGDSGQIGVEGVKGSPFHPTNLYP